MKAIRMFALLVSLALLSPSLVWAHGGNGHGQHRSAEESGICARVIQRQDAEIPDFNSPRWKLVDVVDYRKDFRWEFFRDTARPEILVAGMKTTRIDPVTGLESVDQHWQDYGLKFTAGIKNSPQKDICVIPVVARDGSWMDLTGFYARIKNEEELWQMPPGAEKAYDSLAGKSVSRGQITTTLAAKTKSGRAVEFTALIMVWDTPEVALFFYLGVDGGQIQMPEWRRILEIRWKDGDSVRVWSRKELTLDDGDKILIDPSLYQRHEFTPQASDSVF